MNICIVGWYGTETLGDRSILIGLAKIINNTYGKCKIYLGSLNKFYSERCLLEDGKFYETIAPDIKIVIFDEKKIDIYKNIIRNSDLVVMGGGPIMDLQELGIIEFGFIYAKQNKVKTALLGCGLGPLLNKQFQKITAHILTLSDLIIFRDKISAELANELIIKYNVELKNDIMYSHDPAIIPVGHFLDQLVDENRNISKLGFENTLIINLREFPKSVYNIIDKNNHNDIFINLISSASNKFDQIILIPMHTFSIGGDDRLFLSKINHLTNFKNVMVLHKPISVYELFMIIYSSSHCIGMRYHSVVFQTLLNGKNAILDYTEPNIGKTSGFLNLIGASKHYNELYYNLHKNDFTDTRLIYNLINTSMFKYDKNIFSKTIYKYSNCLKHI